MDYEKRTYFKDDNFEVVLEHTDGRFFVHVGIFKATKTSIKKIKEKWGEIVFGLYREGYDELYTYTKDSRIVKMIGGAEFLGIADAHEVYKWDLT